MSQTLLSLYKFLCCRLLKKKVAIAIFLSILIFLPISIIGTQSYAKSPSAAFLVDLEGGSNSVRRGGNDGTNPIKPKDLLNSEDTLYIPGDRKSWASLGFVIGKVRDYAGLILKTQPYSKTSEYRFPCTASGGFTIAWRPTGEGDDRACGDGLKLERGSSEIYSRSSFFPGKAIAQADEPNRKQNLKAQNPTGATSTDLSDDLLIQPGESQIVVRVTNEPKNEKASKLVRVPYTPEGGEWSQETVLVERNAVRIEVLEGEIAVKSKANSGGKTIREGEKYSYPEDQSDKFISSQEANSCEILRFLNAAYWSSSDNPAISNGIAKQLKQHREALGVSGRPPSNLSTLEQGVFEEMNRLRTNPSAYADLLEKQKQHFYKNSLKLRGETVDLNRRVSAVDDAVRLLRSQRPLPPLSISTGMSRANRDHVNNQGRSGEYFGHTGDDSTTGSGKRLSRYGSVGCFRSDEDEFENMIYFEQPADQGAIPTDRAVVMEMLINYRPRRTGNPDNLFNPDFQVTGVACGSHSNLREMCAITYAEGYLEKN